MKELFRVGANCVMLQAPGSQEAFTLNGKPDLQKEAGELAGVQHFVFASNDIENNSHNRQEAEMTNKE